MVIKQLGQISHSQDIGYKGMSQKYIWSACMDCGIQRWVQLYRGKPRNLRCKICNGKQRGKHHTNWKGGEVKLPDGYIKVWVSPDDFFYPMADKRGYVLQHRLIMATHLGRNLLKAEQVHHKNGIKSDNYIENLELMPSIESHNKYNVCSSCVLRKEIRLLRWQIKELSEALQGRLEI